MAGLDVGVAVTGTPPAATIDAEVVATDASGEVRHQFSLLVARARMADVHGPALPLRPRVVEHPGGLYRDLGSGDAASPAHQEPGLALVASHLEMARRDPDYKFVLGGARLPEALLGRLIPRTGSTSGNSSTKGRLEFVGGTYNEPNTNLTSAN